MSHTPYLTAINQLLKIATVELFLSAVDKSLTPAETISLFLYLQGIMLVYDITNEKSFENIRNWVRNIEEVISLFTYH